MILVLLLSPLLLAQYVERRSVCSGAKEGSGSGACRRHKHHLARCEWDPGYPKYLDNMVVYRKRLTIVIDGKNEACIDALSSAVCDVDGDGLNEVMLLLEDPHRGLHVACYKLVFNETTGNVSLFLQWREDLGIERRVNEKLLITKHYVIVVHKAFDGITLIALNKTTGEEICSYTLPIEWIVPGWIMPRYYVLSSPASDDVIVVYTSNCGVKLIGLRFSESGVTSIARKSLSDMYLAGRPEITNNTLVLPVVKPCFSPFYVNLNASSLALINVTFNKTKLSAGTAISILEHKHLILKRCSSRAFEAAILADNTFVVFNGKNKRCKVASLDLESLGIIDASELHALRSDAFIIIGIGGVNASTNSPPCARMLLVRVK